MTDKIRFKELSKPLQIGIIGGFAYVVVVIVMFFVGLGG